MYLQGNWFPFSPQMEYNFAAEMWNSKEPQQADREIEI